MSRVGEVRHPIALTLPLALPLPLTLTLTLTLTLSMALTLTLTLTLAGAAPLAARFPTGTRAYTSSPWTTSGRVAAYMTLPPYLYP